MENTHRPAPGMIGRTGELPLRTARFSDSGCNPPALGEFLGGQRQPAAEMGDVDELMRGHAATIRP